MEKWQLETAERLASIERSIKYIEVNLTNLPPSPSCITADVKLERRIEALEEFKKYVLIRVAWIAGAFAVITSGFVSAFDTIRESIFKIH
jgi:hypothetical protein